MRLNLKSDISADNTVSPLFTLGIHTLQEELSHMPAGGVWWLNIDDRNSAVNLINQMIISQHSSARVAVIAPSEILTDKIKFQKKSGPESIDLFSLPDEGGNIGDLPRDLMCSLDPEHYFFIVLYPENAFDKTDEQGLRSDLQALSAWATQQQCSLLLINTGNYINKQYSFLLQAHQSISGLARLVSNHYYDVAFWCNERGVSAGQRLTVQYNDNFWRVIYNTHSIPQNYGDDNVIISHIDVLEGAPRLSEYWQLCESNKLVFELASAANAATVIFYFSHASEIINLSYQIHTLRMQRGSALKIIVREKYGKLRAVDVQLLLNCGATLVIPEEVSLPRSLNMIKSVQGTLFSQTLSNDLDTIIRQTKPKEIKGYQSKELFRDVINELIQNPILPADHKGVLVALRPVAGLRPEQTVTLCRIKRMGDIITVDNNGLMLFLAHCHINDVDAVLQRLFPLTLSNIFSQSLMWHTDEQITEQLHRLSMMQPIPWTEHARPDDKDSTDIQPAIQATAPHSAVPLTLLGDSQSEKP